MGVQNKNDDKLYKVHNGVKIPINITYFEKTKQPSVFKHELIQKLELAEFKSICYKYSCRYFCFLFNHTQWWSGVTPRYSLKNHFWCCSDDHMRFWRSNSGWPKVRQAPYPLYYLSKLFFMMILTNESKNMLIMHEKIENMTRE